MPTGARREISRILRYFGDNHARCPSSASRISLIAFGEAAVWFRRAHAHLTLLTAMADLVLQMPPSLSKRDFLAQRLFPVEACFLDEKPFPTKASPDMDARAAQ